MSNLQFGILTITFCSIGYFFSWRYWTKENYTIAILLLIICGLGLRIYASTDFFLHPWDERYHALVAKNLIQHPLLPTLYDNPVLPYNFKDWTANHVWVHKQPFPLWTMAGSLWLFGINEIALRLPSIILTTIGIWLTFFIGSYFFNKKVGYLAAFFYSINGLIIELTGGRWPTDHSDIFFLFFVELAIFFSIAFAQKKKTIYNVLVGFCIGAAILSKWLPALIVLPIWLLIVIDSGNFKSKSIFFQLLILLITCIVVFLPWQLYIFKTFPAEASWEASFNFRHITEVLEGHGGSFFYFINRIRINYGELIYLPLLWFLWKTIKNTTDLKRLAISIWFMVPLFFFSIAKTKMPTYILFASPALFIMISEFWFMLFDYRKNHKLKWLFNLILILLIAFPVRYTIERTKPFDRIDRNPEWVSDLKNLNDKKIKNGILFNYDRPIEAMFYTNLTAYSYIPEREVVIDLIGRGYAVIIKNNGNIPDDIKSIKEIQIVK
jgi:4-amino-4-deoxy-L-arabinose transferase-like glycosyltransferase